MEVSWNPPVVVNGYTGSSSTGGNATSLQSLNRVAGTSVSSVATVPLATRPVSGQVYPR